MDRVKPLFQMRPEAAPFHPGEGNKSEGMTVKDYSDNDFFEESDMEKKLRMAFILLRNLKHQINNELGSVVLTELAMGMTNDYKVAIQEGSTMVRVGTGLFGVRNYQ